MEIIQETVEFAKKIQQTEQYLNLQKAKKNNDSDENLQNLINEFNMVKLKFEHSLEKSEENRENSEKLNSLYDKIMQNENMIFFNKVSDEMNKLMNDVNKILISAVNGNNFENFNKFDFEKNSDCEGNCENCLGCF